MTARARPQTPDAPKTRALRQTIAMRFSPVRLTLGAVALVGVGAWTINDIQNREMREIVSKGATNFTSQSHGFAVWLPKQPAQKQKTLKANQYGAMTPKFFSAESDSVTYEVVATPTSPQVDKSDPDGHLARMERAFLKPPDVKLQQHEAISRNGFPGVELKISRNKGRETHRAQFYFTPQVFLMIFASGPKAAMQKQSAQINRVFDSFRILPQK